MVKITISCCLCSANREVEIDEGAWALQYDGADIENAFCPEHAPVKAFCDSQCVGCVSGWGDCGLWKAFAFSHSRDPKLTGADHEALRSGRCPKRVNGTIGLFGGSIESIHLESDDAAAGAALSAAITAYEERYRTGSRDGRA